MQNTVVLMTHAHTLYEQGSPRLLANHHASLALAPLAPAPIHRLLSHRPMKVLTPWTTLEELLSHCLMKALAP